MDQRPPRPPIHNPNHQSSMQGPPPTQPTVYQPPSSQQPPVQIPFSDPFSHRRGPDPFMPSSQSQRRGSYGLPSGREPATVIHNERAPLAAPWPPTTGAPSSSSQPHHYQASSSAPPPPPQISSAQTSTYSAPYGYDSTRRRSLGGHNGTDSQPAPSGFGRQMPPPSPSQQSQSHLGFASGRPPPPPSFGTGRELPSLGSGSRPSSGFSISSILGGDPPASQPPHSQPHHSPPITTQSPGVSSIQPSSPRRSHSSSFGAFGQWRRPQTPERGAVSAGVRSQESSQATVASFGPSRHSPEYPRANVPYGQYPPPPPISRPAQSSPEDISRQATDRGPPRPSSQPLGYAPPLREDPYAPHPQPSYRPPNGSAHDQRHAREEPRPPISAYEDRNSSPSASRDRSITSQPLGHSGYSPPQELHRRNVNRDYLMEDRQREPSPLRREDSLTGYRGYRELLREPGQGEPPRSHPSSTDPFRTQSEPQQATDILEGQQNRQLHAHPPERSFSGEYPRSSPYDLPRASGEEMQRSRSFLGITDPSRRGRASPLPQAVQGAQPQLTGPGGDPSIKREFGAIFQGLGSGLGGHIPGNSTPSRQSPMPQRASMTDDVAPIVLSDNDGAMSRTGSRGAKKSKRVKDEADSRMDLDSNDGRNTPGSRSAKRTKLSHHHHLPHTHPHHHHIHNHGLTSAEAESTMPPSQSALTSRFHSSTPQSAPSSTTAHHHHHIHPPAHSHHHHFTAAPRTTSAGPAATATPTQAAPPLRKPTLRISSAAVLDQVKDLPRNHIGSELYAPAVEAASPRPASSVLNAAKGGVRRVYKPTRAFTERDLNCTFTIRVPRFYLAPAERARVCADRCLWGSDVYTDDSDPLAAAVHAGWLRGEWDGDVDAAQLGLAEPLPPNAEDDAGGAAPPAPALPPPDADLHITVLVVPRLRRYADAARNGIASRPWGPGHDGLSYVIHKMRWVDEGPARAMPRSGKARRVERRRKARAAEAFRGVVAAERARLAGAAERGRRKERVEGALGGGAPLAVAAA